LQNLINQLSPPRPESSQRTQRSRTQGVQSMMQSAVRGISSGSGPITGSQKLQLELAEAALKPWIEKVNLFFTTDWPEYKTYVGESAISPFKDRPFEALKFE